MLYNTHIRDIFHTIILGFVFIETISVPLIVLDYGIVHCSLSSVLFFHEINENSFRRSSQERLH